MLTLVTNWIKDKRLQATRLCRATTSFAVIIGTEHHQKRRDMREMADEIKAYQAHWMACIIAIFAKVAMVDGVISALELALAEEMFVEMELTRADSPAAFETFEHAKKSPTSLFHTAVGIRDVCKPDQQTVTIFTAFAFRMAHANGELSPQGKDALLTICDVFHLSYDNYYQNFLDYQAYRQSEKDRYEALGCKPTDADELIEERYRSLVHEFHPDQIALKGLAPDFVKFAEEKFKKIRAAYEVITANRAHAAKIAAGSPQG